MEEERKTSLKVVLHKEVHQQMRRILYSQGDIQHFFSAVVAALVMGELKTTLGEVLEAVRRR